MKKKKKTSLTCLSFFLSASVIFISRRRVAALQTGTGRLTFLLKAAALVLLLRRVPSELRLPASSLQTRTQQRPGGGGGAVLPFKSKANKMLPGTSSGEDALSLTGGN